MLHAAAYNDNGDCLQTLLENNANVNARDKLGQTALMMAAKRGHSSVIGLFICFFHMLHVNI